MAQNKNIPDLPHYTGTIGDDRLFEMYDPQTAKNYHVTKADLAAVFAGGGSYGFDNGLSNVDGQVGLGGELIEDETNIEGFDKSFVMITNATTSGNGFIRQLFHSKFDGTSAGFNSYVEVYTPTDADVIAQIFADGMGSFSMRAPSADNPLGYCRFTDWRAEGLRAGIEYDDITATGAGFTDNSLISKGFADNSYAPFDVLGDYLPLAGGEMTGDIITDASITAVNTLTGGGIYLADAVLFAGFSAPYQSILFKERQLFTETNNEICVDYENGIYKSFMQRGGGLLFKDFNDDGVGLTSLQVYFTGDLISEGSNGLKQMLSIQTSNNQVMSIGDTTPRTSGAPTSAGIGFFNADPQEREDIDSGADSTIFVAGALTANMATKLNHIYNINKRFGFIRVI